MPPLSNQAMTNVLRYLTIIYDWDILLDNVILSWPILLGKAGYWDGEGSQRGNNKSKRILEWRKQKN
jgi:hypothetical protein